MPIRSRIEKNPVTEIISRYLSYPTIMRAIAAANKPARTTIATSFTSICIICAYRLFNRD